MIAFVNMYGILISILAFHMTLLTFMKILKSSTQEQQL